ncbi:hypothetical protein EKS21_07325 [Streptococcus mutans]|nr:hypothetical protein [Streptococcus mutans]
MFSEEDKAEAEAVVSVVDTVSLLTVVVSLLCTSVVTAGVLISVFSKFSP